MLALGLASRTSGMRGKYSCYATILDQLYIKPQDLTICFFPSSFIHLTNIFFLTLTKYPSYIARLSGECQ